MDVEKFDTFHEVYKYLNNGDFNELTFTDEKVELAEPKPVYLAEGYTNISFGTSQLAKAMQRYWSAH